MNKYRSNGLDNVSAGRFIERGYSGPDINKIKSLSNAVAGEMTGNSLTVIKNISSDYIITPEEKANLKTEWDYIEAAFNSASATAEKLGVITSPEYIEYKKSYDKLKLIMDELFMDMNATSNIDTSFDTALTQYYNSANTYNIYITLLKNDIINQLYGVSLVLIPNKKIYSPTDMIEFEARIYIYPKGGKLRPLDSDIKALYRDPDGLYSSLYKWHIKGTNRDSAYESEFLGKDKLVINAADLINKSVSVSFESEMVVG